MCLTEPHAGTDLGSQNQAVPQADGSYRITGTKIFITAGEHDLTENIIHLVLASSQMRLPGRRVFPCLWFQNALDNEGDPPRAERCLRGRRTQDGHQGICDLWMNFTSAWVSWLAS